MTFATVLSRFREFDFEDHLRGVTEEKIDAILEKDKINEKDFLSLLSPVAQNRLERMAVKAHSITKRHFGKTVQLFTPFYISNYCDNACAYCSFARQHAIKRRCLSFHEIRDECRLIKKKGIRHILVLTGESRINASVGYITESIRIIKEYFPSIGIEIYPLKEEEYGNLIDQGVDGLTIFQETYNEGEYHRYHRGGPKDDFAFRLEAPDRACRRGIRTLSIGALLGLSLTYRDIFFTGLHALYLRKNYPQAELSISFPRIRPLAGDFRPPFPVADAFFVQIIIATRIFFPNIGITLSSRESKQLRNSLLPLGVTKMSAGVSTAVGSHSETPSTAQFEIADRRSVAEMATDLIALGYQPVMQDWNIRF